MPPSRERLGVSVYYRCADNRKRGTCANALSVKEEVARKRIFEALQERLSSASAVEFLRKKIVEFLGDANREANRELQECRARLERTEQRIGRLVEYLASGERSDYVGSTLRDLEDQARSEKEKIAEIEAQATLPVALPTANQVLQRTVALGKLFEQDPIEVREALGAVVALVSSRSGAPASSAAEVTVTAPVPEPSAPKAVSSAVTSVAPEQSAAPVIALTNLPSQARAPKTDAPKPQVPSSPPAAATAATAKTAKPSCTPPYALDPVSGKKRWKPECL